MSCKRNTSRGCCFGKNSEGATTAKAIEGCNKMETWDWLADMPNPMSDNSIYEIHFKNTRKGYYTLPASMTPLKKGDIVAVESSPGHDVGIVSLTGAMVGKQMRRCGFNPEGAEFKRILRLATTFDIERWQEAISLEYNTMIRSREIVAQLGLNMKVGDVEYQGDRLKAIFYYIADQRVDFRELIKVLAEQFRIRIEMKQIGARQEAGRIGGISACGRELCCSTWQNNFSTVTIGAARHQEISLNPQKLAGQCGKLKCCLNYEVDNYIDARRDFPRLQGPLEAMDGTYHLVKSDLLAKVMWFSPDPSSMAIMIPLGVDRVRKIAAMNRKGVKVDKLEDETIVREVVAEEPSFENVVGQDSLTRFDRQGGGGGSKNSRNRKRPDRQGGAGERSADRPSERPNDRSNDRDRAAQKQNRPERAKTTGETPNPETDAQQQERRQNNNRNNRNRSRQNIASTAAENNQSTQQPKENRGPRPEKNRDNQNRQANPSNGANTDSNGAASPNTGENRENRRPNNFRRRGNKPNKSGQGGDQ